MKKITLYIILTATVSVYGQAPKDSIVLPTTQFKIDGEWRPRFEYRDGYKKLPDSTTSPAAFITQRARLNIFYKKEKFSTFLSIQDIRVWGDHEFRDISGTISTFQAWAEIAVSKRISARFGRQTLIYDNERLFAQNNWRQNGGSHDALLFKYRGNKTEADFAVAFNQPTENTFGTDYTALQSKGNYKLLLVQWYTRKLNDNFRLSILNAADGFQSDKQIEHMYLRHTNGGRIEFNKNKFYATVSGYYQHGKTQKGQELSAYYIQPEIKYELNNAILLRLGAEYLSGKDATDTANKKNNSFVPLYGVAHRFMGYMDYFTKFPDDVKDAGLVNPYLFTSFNLSKKLTLKSDFHLFFSQNKYVRKGEVIDKYLGFENDILLIYKPSKEISTEVGYSWMIAEKSMEIIRGGDSSRFPQWFYIMVTVKPELFNFQK
jgi:hypothetical protein